MQHVIQEQNKIKKKTTTDLITIVISRENYAKLRDLGRTGDSFNDVVTEMLKEIESKRKQSKNVLIAGDVS